MSQKLDAETVRIWGEQYSNWGRWGEDDERGAVNFITPERVRAACALPPLPVSPAPVSVTLATSG